MDVRGVELRHLRYFLAVADELHFTRAARQLGIAQPPLSQQIQRLEQLLDVALFERRPRLALTPAGRQLASTARELLARVSSGLLNVQEVAAGRDGPVRIGFASSTLLNVFPKLVRGYRQRRPRVQLHLSSLASSQQIEQITSGAIDVAVIRHPPIPGHRCVVVHTEKYFVAMPRRHRLAGTSRLKLRQLNGEAYVHFPRVFAPYLYDQIEELWRHADVRPDIVQEAAEWLTIVGLVESGLGVSLVPASFAKLRWGGVLYRELSDQSTTSVTTVCLPGQELSPAAEAFLEEARRLCGG